MTIATITLIAATLLSWVAYWAFVTRPIDKEIEDGEAIARAEMEDWDNLLNKQ